MKALLNDKQKWLIPWVIAIAMFMETLDSTIVSVAIPHIALNFGINPINLKLALTSYLLSLSIFIPISGWIADKYQSGKVFGCALFIFTLSSLLCGLSSNLMELVFSRFLQGFGGALMMPVGRLILLRIFSKEEMIRAFGIMIVPGLVGPAIGPILGGLILQVTTWHWIFFVNIPFGILGILTTYILLPATDMNTLHPPFDWRGFILFSLGLMLLTIAMAIMGDNFTLLNDALLLLGLSSIFLSLYGYFSKKQTYPLLDLSLFRKKTFMVSMAINFLIRIGTGSVQFLIPLMIQLIWKKTALFSGIMFLFLVTGMMSSRICLNQILLTKITYRQFLSASIIVLSFLSVNLCWFVQPGSGTVLAIFLFVIGMVTTQLYMGFGILYRVELVPSEFSQAASIASTIQQFSAGFGIALAAIVLHALKNGMGWPLFSRQAFFWTFIILNGIGMLSLYFTQQLDKNLRFSVGTEK